ncbi:hypothetical protein [Canibacter zhoujuaniae]|uniref:hypothetical protein n=1 Tax=Canibacter zhoujuaniae TaxID=2708343 RepID=UPI0014235905|nr:hypothetical protein [Canibacter zhoujuaniae]
MSDSTNNMAEAKEARTELQQTLGLLSQRLDFGTRIDNAISRQKARLIALRKRQPAVFIAGVTAVALLAGAAVTGAALAVTKRLSE